LVTSVVKDNDMELDAVQPPHQAVNRRKETAKDLVLDPEVANAAAPPYDQVVAKLEDKLSQARARQTAISGERKTISLAAHMGSANERARLDQLNQEGAILSGEIESLEAAIADAQAWIANAEAAAAIEAERQKRQEVVQLAGELRGHAEKIDSLWRKSIEEYLVLQLKLNEVAQSGVGRPSRHQVQAACRRALISAFIRTPLQLELLAPGERHTVAQLVATWARNVEAWANQALPRANGKDAA
jgi:predicted  nucleic acid-binding Zn-ribbon protein